MKLGPFFSIAAAIFLLSSSAHAVLGCPTREQAVKLLKDNAPNLVLQNQAALQAQGAPATVEEYLEMAEGQADLNLNQNYLCETTADPNEYMIFIYYVYDYKKGGRISAYEFYFLVVENGSEYQLENNWVDFTNYEN